jgi:hypothetical protein
VIAIDGPPSELELVGGIELVGNEVDAELVELGVADVDLSSEWPSPSSKPIKAAPIVAMAAMPAITDGCQRSNRLRSRRGLAIFPTIPDRYAQPSIKVHARSACNHVCKECPYDGPAEPDVDRHEQDRQNH